MYVTTAPIHAGEFKQPGHKKTAGVCWWSGRRWCIRHRGEVPCPLEHTFGDPEPDEEGEHW